MGRAWESEDEVEIPASPEEVWEAIATGPGIDSWFMGRSEVDPGPGGTVHTTVGGYRLESTVTTWEPPHRFGYRGMEGPDGRFVAFEYLIEGRDRGSTVLRVVASGFLPGDDWEAEYEAMTRGGHMYVRTLVEYLTHFRGRTGTPVCVSGPPVSDWDRTWPALRAALGVGPTATVGDAVTVPAGGVVDYLSTDCIGIRTPDALYRFIRGFFGSIVVGHHLFAPDADAARAQRYWESWLEGIANP